MRHALLMFAAAYELLRLGVITGFKFKGPYWRWRMHTAFGRGMPEGEGGAWSTVKSVIDYGKWVHQQRMSRP